MTGLSTSTLLPGTDLARLGHLLYQKALVRRSDEPIIDPRGNPIGWLLDTRIPMLESEIFTVVGQVLADKLTAQGVEQVVGYGYGSFPMVCSVLSAPGGGYRGGFIRDQRKTHGRRRLVEGPLDRSKPVVLLDDILNSGRSASRAVNMLRGDLFNVVGLLTLFNFTWGGGLARMESDGLWVDSILDLNLRDQNGSKKRVVTR
jgi:orotate phosphoribosyltransferase